MEFTPADHFDALNLYARYNRTVDAGDVDGWLECYAPDGQLSIPSANVTYTGRFELAAFVKRYIETSAGSERHFISNIELSVVAEGLRGRAALMTVRPGSRKMPPALLTTGVYEDLLSRTAGGWRFAVRSLTFDRPDREN
ncbi:nuclear transport factor 2 family protein [Microbacterium rhizomatis]|uniref:Nuclear transport factor 2 family protein n=1 Tax=Microbacterium rhizomatis TaxID=1631477 RepID=A0A5J5IXD6_9MICO|nr:nuclear transport factor 2 family protein [Microbacterium rhizomatis]KAA9105915.1 nuclear transport factor 2 family protein [Microbacterium rhizomatis]